METTSQFAELGAAPTVVSALTTKGYLIPTPVQAAVISAPPQDLLVTAQTGSGKTVAFGLVIAQMLLGDADKITHAKAPRALVITPTRELAAQVQRELAWLLADAGARVSAFTGGTDLRGDSRSISRGVEVAVGTPGRLIDLLERKALDLSAVQVLVLDEADEMLDMGFRDAIEALCAAAPAERRTLLFSATLPSEIRSLAKKYQKNALPVDARSTTQGAHDDITYAAHLCQNGERTRALVNVLRMADDEKCLVFCRTREAVGELHRELASRGFLAAAISGERAQAERDRALETMRQGRVRVLVATNVAARGLDLPELQLVVHAALPENVEALTHRSGRTGRAGKKGRSLFLVETGERRRAERLFHAAKLPIVFTAPPTLDDVARHEREALRTEVTEAMEHPVPDTAIELATQLLAKTTPEQLVAALLDRALKARPAGEKLTSIDVRAPQRSKSDGPRTGTDTYTLFQVNLGAKDQAQVNWILPLICRRGNVTRNEIGAIRVARDRTYVEISTRAATEFAANAKERDPRAPNVHIEPAEGSLPPRVFDSGGAGPKKGPPRAFNKPGEGRPGFDRTAAVKPAFEKRSFDNPGFDKAGFDRPKPADRPKAFDKKPGFDKPSYGDKPKPAYGSKPGYGGKPAYGTKPAFGKPTTRKPPR